MEAGGIDVPVFESIRHSLYRYRSSMFKGKYQRTKSRERPNRYVTVHAEHTYKVVEHRSSCGSDAAEPRRSYLPSEFT